MSQYDRFDNTGGSGDEELDALLRQTKDDLDELIRQTKEELSRDSFLMEELPEPELPEEYVDHSAAEEPAEEPEEEAPGGMPGVLKALVYVCLVLSAAVLLAVGAWKCADEVCALTAENRVVSVTVKPEATIADITSQLAEKGLIEQEWLFSLYCMISNAADKIDPGTYELNAVYDYRALVYGMVETGENRATATITVPEGYELDDIFALLEEKQICDAESLRKAAAEYAFSYWFLEGMPYGDYRRLEGYLYPDTYEFYLDDTPENVLSKFLRNFDARVTDEMRADLQKLNEELHGIMADNGFTESEVAASSLSFHDVVIVASLVEKETSGTAESGKIASVIYNRLCSKLYPCLNLDSTIQYALPERKDILTNADKAVISPYNTYTNAGLPAGPISNPGMSSLRAALYPVNTDYFFFALEPDGTHYFSETVYEHQQYLDILTGSNLPAEEETPEDEETGE